jgi:dipeptidyl aminopeptidase/acylaminoacyl peptidase
MAARRGWQRRRVSVLAGLAVAAAVLAVLRADYSAPVGPSMLVSPPVSLVDEPVTVSVRDLHAGQRTTVTATATDAGGTTWSASALFEASPDGVVSLDRPSLGGSYSGVDPMGLFELMAPPSGSTATVFLSPGSGYDVTLHAAVGDRVAATAIARRQTPAAVGVVEKEVPRGSGRLYGRLYLPRSTSTKRPAVLMFGGSEGGLGTAFSASLLAAHGYPSLALAYFAVPGLPQELADIPLEYFADALAVLRTQPGVDPRRVLVAGASRGGEAALLLGAYFPRLVSGVIAGVPSSVVNPGRRSGIVRPAWTLRGRPLPAVTTADVAPADPPRNPQAVIPVDRIRGPILLTCGELDVVWPSCGHVDAITRRLAARNFRYPVTALRYPDAGHLIGGLTAYFPSLTDEALTSYGGTVTGTQAAQADAHATLLAFLASQ